MTRSCKKRNSFACKASGRSPISSRNSVPLSASSILPGVCLTAPVNAPFSWPNSSLSSRFSGIAAQLMATNCCAAPMRQIVQRARQQLLAGSRFTQQHHRRAGVGHTLHRAAELLHLRISREDPGQALWPTRRLKTLVFLLQLGQPIGSRNDQAQDLRIKRLFAEVIRPESDGFERIGAIMLPRDDDDLAVRKQFENLAEQA